MAVQSSKQNNRRCAYDVCASWGCITLCLYIAQIRRDLLQCASDPFGKEICNLSTCTVVRSCLDNTGSPLTKTQDTTRGLFDICVGSLHYNEMFGEEKPPRDDMRMSATTGGHLRNLGDLLVVLFFFIVSLWKR